jgi:hypothetical protein
MRAAIIHAQQDRAPILNRFRELVPDAPPPIPLGNSHPTCVAVRTAFQILWETAERYARADAEDRPW